MSLPGTNFTDKISITELNEILLNSIPNSWSKKAYVQDFGWDSIALNKSFNMFERMEIAESIYEGVEEPFYKKPTRADTNLSGHNRHKRVEAALSWTRPKKGVIAGKHKKLHVDSLSGKSKTCLIHVPRHYSEEFRVLGYFETKFANSIPTKNRGSNPVPRGEINKQQEWNGIVNNALDEILLTEDLKISDVREAPEFLDSDYDENDLYQDDKISLEETKEKIELHKRMFE